jgi:hypothetical protein
MPKLRNQLNVEYQGRCRYYVGQHPSPAHRQVMDRQTGQARTDLHVMYGNLVRDVGNDLAVYNPVLDRWEQYGAH